MLDLMHVFAGHAQHVHDDGGRQRHGEVGDDVDVLTRLEPSGEVVDNRLHGRPEVLDHLRVDSAAHQAPQPPVLRRVSEGDPQAEIADDLGEDFLGRRGKGLVEIRQTVGRHLGIQRDGFDVLVAGHDPALQDRGPVHRIGVAQATINWKRVAPDSRVGGIVDKIRYRHPVNLADPTPQNDCLVRQEIGGR